MSLSWITVAWSVAAGACLSVALIYLVSWLRQVEKLAYLAFSMTAVSLAAIALFELLLMRAQTAAEFGTILRWAHIPVFTLLMSIVVFVRAYLGTGRLWLAWSICGLRLLVLVLNFQAVVNINYLEISDLRQVSLFGEETGMIAVGVENPWIKIAEFSELLLALFLLDALSAAWRRDNRVDRHRAAMIGGSLFFSFVIASGNAALINAGIIQSVYFVSLPFLAVVAAIGHLLGADIIRADQFAVQLARSESERRINVRRMEEATEAAGIAVWEWDIASDEIWIIDRGRALFGFATDERIDLNRFLAALHPDDRHAARESLNAALATTGTFEDEYRTILPGGVERWIRTRGRAGSHRPGVPPRVRGVSFDITERRELTDLLKAERAFLRQVIDITPNLLYAKDRQGRFTLVNQAVANLFGKPVEDLIGKTDADLNSHAEEVERFRQADAEVMDTLQEKFIFEEKITDAAGKIHWLQTVKRPVMDKDGSANLVLGSSTDVTLRRQTELELARQRSELAHLSRVTILSELSGSLAHELNQPLTAILSNAQAAQRFLAGADPDLAELREIMQDIVDDDKRAGEVILGLRMLLKKGELRREPLDINLVAQDVVRLMRSDLVNDSVVMSLDLAPDLPAILGDRVQLQQVLLNLVMNGSEIMLNVAATDRKLAIATTRDDENTVRVTVTDCGPGIAPAHLERVFEPYFTTKPHGLGLGLQVCQRIITAHDGRLWATNNPVRGATFHLTLPVNPEGMA